MNEEAWRRLDLTLAQLKAMVMLGTREEGNVTDLARALGIGIPATSATLKSLVERDLAYRHEDKHNRRRILVGLTPQGVRLMATLRVDDQDWLPQPHELVTK